MSDKQKWKATKLTVEGKPIQEGAIMCFHDLQIRFDDEDVNRLVGGLRIEALPNEPVIAHISLYLSELELKNMPIEIRAQFDEYMAQLKAAPFEGDMPQWADDLIASDGAKMIQPEYSNAKENN